MNLSNHKFSIPQYKLLNKNLNFCPTPGNYNQTTLQNDINNFTRKIKLKAHFATNEQQINENEQPQKQFYIKKANSTWEPPNNHHTVKTFIEAITNDIEKLPDTNVKRKYNLTKAERQALEELKERNDIIITNADKGGAVVIQDTKDYVEEANRQLNDTNFYKRCERDLTESHCKQINNTINNLQAANMITEKTANMLKTKNAKTPKFYTLPKIHKKDNPGRPVISSINCHSANISKYVDHHLQEHVTKLPSYVKDTTDFLNKISTVTIPEGAKLVTMDVSSLYTNIPNSEGIEAVQETLTKNNCPNTLIHVIVTFLTMILTLNNFIFNGLHYLQVKGCAMGTKCAPGYANIFMGVFEAEYIYHRIKNKSLLYLRYIDDIFMIWTGTTQELKRFTDEINQVHPSIKFTTESSHEEINFLDTTVYIHQNKLSTKVYRKPTDRSMYLHNNSYHPNNLKTNIPYGQALRLKKICTENDNYNKSLNDLNNAFLKRGYTQDNLSKQFERASAKERSQLLKEKECHPPKSKIPFITTFNKTLPKIKDTINKHWNLLQINDNLKNTFQEQPVYAYRRNKNLRDIIGQTTLLNSKVVRKKELKVGKCRPCLTQIHNQCCKQVTSTTNFTSQQTKQTFKIYHNLNCRSDFVIYLLECRRCKIQYIGKSEPPFNLRLNKHRNDAKNPKEDTIEACKHFNQHHRFNRDAKFTLIEQIKDKRKSREELRTILLKRENFWINKLKTLKPYGLNQELNRC